MPSSIALNLNNTSSSSLHTALPLQYNNYASQKVLFEHFCQRDGALYNDQWLESHKSQGHFNFLFTEENIQATFLLTLEHDARNVFAKLIDINWYPAPALDVHEFMLKLCQKDDVWGADGLKAPRILADICFLYPGFLNHILNTATIEDLEMLLPHAIGDGKMMIENRLYL